MYDALLGSLTYLCRYFGVDDTPKVLTAGLPLVEGRLTASLLPRAAKRVGLDLQLESVDISQLSSALCPFIALLNDNQAAVITAISEHNIEVYSPQTEHIQRYSSDELKDQLTGHYFLIRKPFRLDPRSKARQTQPCQGQDWFWSTLWYSKSIYRDVLVASFLINLFALVVPLFTRLVYDKVLPNLAFDTLWVLTSGVILALVFDFALKMMRSHFIDVAAKKSDVLLSTALFSKVLGLRLEAKPASVGAFTRHIQEFDFVRDFFASTTINTLIDLPFTLLFLCVIWLIAGHLVWVPIIGMLLLLGISLILRRPLARSIEQSARIATQKQADLFESLAGLETVKLHNAEGSFLLRLENAVAQFAHWSMTTRRWSDWIQTSAMSIQQLSTVGLILFGVYAIAAGELSMGALIAVTMLNGRAIGPMVQLALLVTRYQQARSSLAMLNSIIRLPDEQTHSEHSQRHLTLTGPIEFKQVSFRYPESKLNALNAVSFTIQPGEKVAVVGRIGSGKTTLERLLTRLYHPNEGQILFDHYDIQHYHASEVRQHIGCVSQDSLLFYGSIRDNITLGNHFVSDHTLQDAIVRSGVDQFIQRDPQGLARQVGEGGSWLSGGQRQAIAFARALVKQPKLLLLDEPTSAMDNRSEQTIKRTLHALSEHDTLILITHKTTMLDVVDRVIILDNGNLIADGPKQQILTALQNGKIYPSS